MAAIKFGNRKSSLKLEEIKCGHQTGVYCFILYDIKQPAKKVYEPSSQHYAMSMRLNERDLKWMVFNVAFFLSLFRLCSLFGLVYAFRHFGLMSFATAVNMYASSSNKATFTPKPLCSQTNDSKFGNFVRVAGDDVIK